MAISGLDDFSAAYLDNLKLQADQTRSADAAAKAKDSVNGLSNEASDEELTEAVKSFESYFVEQILKEMKKSIDSINEDEDEDSTVSMMTDMYMDTTIQQIAAEMVDKYGDSMTDSLVAQLKRNYGIADTPSETAIE